MSSEAFICEENGCGRQFATEQALKVHETRTHKKKPPTRITIRIVPGRKRKKKDGR